MAVKLESQGGRVKPYGFVHEYTPEQAQEYFRCMNNPVYFIETYCWIVHPTLGRKKFQLYGFQKRLIQTYIINDRCISLIARQSGKALALDTPILTPSGWSTMGDLKVDDYVYGEDGKPTRITFVTDPMLDHKCYRVRFDNGEEVVADAEHVWTVSSALWRGKKRDLTTEQIIAEKTRLAKMGQGLYIEYTKPIEYESKSLPIDPYVLGIWLGDGNSANGGIAGHIDDIAQIEPLLNQRGYQFGPPTPDKRRPTTLQLTIYDLMPKLRENELLNNKHIPAEYMTSSIEQRLELIRGLMDSDGSCDRRGACEFYQKDKRLIDDFRFILSSLGIKSSIRTKMIDDVPYYTVSFCTVDHRIFNLPRKIERQKNAKGHPKNRRIYFSSIESTESVPVKCIAVDNNSHLYLCGKTLVPTHNTETAAAFLLWWCMFKRDQRVLVASNKGDNAKAIMKRFKFIYEELPWWLKPGVKVPGGWNVFSVEFDNGSYIEAETTTSNTGRGKPISLFYCDELAFVRPSIARDFWTSIFPTISTGGRCIITSTANTDEDLFAQIWLNATLSPLSDKWKDVSADRTMMGLEETEEFYETIYENDSLQEEIHNEGQSGETFDGFVGFHAHWTAVPGRDASFKRKTLSSGTTETEFARDFECSFMSKDSTLISAPKLLALNHNVRPPRFIDQWRMRWYEDIKPNMAYAVALDPSEGVEMDDACIQVFEIPNLKQVAEWNSNTADQPEQARMLMRTLRRIYDIQMDDPAHNGNCDLYYSVEKNGLGVGILTTIEVHGEEKFPGILIDSEGNKGRGLMTTSGSKKRCAIELASLIERNLITLRSKRLVSQLKTFIRRGNRFEAKQGSKDDIVLGTLLSIHLLEEVRNYEPELEDRILVDLDEDYDEDESDWDDSPVLPMIG